MDPNGEGYRPEELTDRPEYPELERPMGPAAQEEERGVVNQNFLESKDPEQHLPEDRIFEK